MRKLISVLFFLVSGLYANAQLFGGNPPSTKWKQIKTDTVRIIYPTGLDSQAQRVAAIVHKLALEKPVSLGDQLKRVDIVLQNQTIIPNGYVQLGPFRSEFFLTPDMNNFGQGTLSWTDQLALHEYRHVQQFNNFNNGLSKLMKTLFGQEGYSLAINASIPDWFYEGDAVYQETLLTEQGRGRIPLFMNAYPSLWREQKKYSWMKLRNGSLKDYVPTHYHLGYLLVNYGRLKYGADFWTKVTKDASAYKGLFYPFQTAIKKYSGKSYTEFREDAFSYYNSKTDEAVTPDSFLFPVKKTYVTNYYFPYSAGEDSLIYLKSGYRERPAFYLHDKSGEKRISIRDISMDEQFSYRNGKIVYAAYENDPRWGWLDYSVLKVLDVQSGQQYSLTRKTRYFTPDISSDGSMVVAVNVDKKGFSSLHILDAANGSVLKEIRSGEIAIFTDPKFIDKENVLTIVRLKNGKSSLAVAGISTGIITRLTNPSFTVTGYPSVAGDKVFFTAAVNGTDNIYALDLHSKTIWQVTRGTAGKYFVNADEKRITWSEFTAEGYQLKQQSIIPDLWLPAGSALPDSVSGSWPVSAAAENVLNNVTTVKEGNYPQSPYKKSTRLLNFHSWRPYYEAPVFTFSLYGENILNTLQTELYYIYNETEKTHGAGFSTVFGGAFPYISAGSEYTFNRESQIGNRIRNWSQLDSRIGLTLPLNQIKGKSYRYFTLSSFYVLRNEFNKDFYKDSLGTTSFGYGSHSISWTQQVQRAVQHIYPRLAGSVTASFRHAITKYEGRQFNGSAALYLPGIMRNHNLVFTGAFQQRDTLGQVSFGNRFPYSRGYTGRYFTRMWKTGVNYHLPVWCPDAGVGNILYIQRLRMNMFYDFTKVYSKDKSQTRNQRSVGGEFFADTKWWNQYPLTFGIRVSHLLDIDQFDGWKGTLFEFVLPVSIFPK